MPHSSGKESAAAAATAATQVQVAVIAAAQDQLQQQLAAYDTPVLFSVQRVYNGVAVMADPSAACRDCADAGREGRSSPHRQRAQQQREHPLSRRTCPVARPREAGAPGGLHGEGVRIAIADTGIDYLHRDFGGPGTGYAENDRTRIGDVQGLSRLACGRRLRLCRRRLQRLRRRGDKSIPHPDPRSDGLLWPRHPCGRHGSRQRRHRTRTTYTGPYDASIDYCKLYIGPGVAPRASIYALKIFGCDGSTNLTDLALEWAVDPNQDGDFGDHVDVINLSLGSPYGWEYDTSVAAANNAALAGVIVVASAGNNGDIQLITSAPASADRAISVAATQHVADTVANFSSRGPWRGDAGLKPDVAAPGTGIVSAKTGSGSERVSSSGTSMAAPHVTGVMALAAPGASRTGA